MGPSRRLPSLPHTALAALALASCLAFAVPAQAQVSFWPPGEQDDPLHYQNDVTQPVQERLEDCWLFEAQAWEQPGDDWRQEAAYWCRTLAERQAKGDLSDRDQALAGVLLAYEAGFRRIVAENLAARAAWEEGINSIDPSCAPTCTQQPPPPPGTPLSLVFRGGWLNSPSQHDELAALTGLDVVLETID